MFELRQDHVAAFEDTAEENFIGRVGVHLRTALPLQTAAESDEAMHQRVRDGAARARSYGLTWERSIVRFMESDYLLGRNFERDPRYDWAPMILGNPQFGQDARALSLVLCAAEAAELRARGGD